MTVDCMREQLLEGKKIRLGDLGDFSILLSSKGAEFKNLIADAEFNLVASRSAQAAVIKAIKEGKANVDIGVKYPRSWSFSVKIISGITKQWL